MVLVTKKAHVRGCQKAIELGLSFLSKIRDVDVSGFALKTGCFFKVRITHLKIA